MEPKQERRPEIKISDTNLMSEDKEQNSAEKNKELLGKCVESSNTHLKKRLHGPQTGDQDVIGQSGSDVILRPKPKKESDEQWAKIWSPAFQWQLFIIVVCVALVNYTQVSLLNKSVHVSDGTAVAYENYAYLSKITKSNSDANVQLKETFQNEKQQVDDAITSIKNDIKYLMHTLLNAKMLCEECKDKVDQLYEVNRKLELMQPNIFNKEMFTMAFMILGFIVLGLAFALFCLYQRHDYISFTGPRELTTPASNDCNNMGSKEILRQVPREVELKQEVCIISLDESRMQDHLKILDSANVPNLQVQSCVIRRHEQIPNMPRSKVYLMCTEFSERHVIIEEPGKGLDDLHRTTYIASKKHGGCLIILYTKDPGSRNLNDNLLYNTRLHCVTCQPELSELNDDGRFFGLYDKLTQHQQTELRNIIVQNMA